MSKRLNFLLIILGIVIVYMSVKISFNSFENRMDMMIAEKEIAIYESIDRNTILINNVRKNNK